MVFAACASQASPPTPTDPVLAQGQKVYNAHCATCHGKSGNGGAGPKLAGVVAERYPNIADQEAVIANGKGGMPAWKNILSPADITAVARYEREWLGAQH